MITTSVFAFIFTGCLQNFSEVVWLSELPAFFMFLNQTELLFFIINFKKCAVGLAELNIGLFCFNFIYFKFGYKNISDQTFPRIFKTRFSTFLLIAH